MTIYYVDGRYVPATEAVLPVDDLAILRGLGAFDLMRTYRGKPYFLKEHIERLELSAEKLGIRLRWSRRQIQEIVLETLSRNPDIDEANIRVIVTGGSSQDFMTPAGKARLLVLITPIPKLPQSWYTQGIKVITHQSQRIVPAAKSISYASASLALKQAKQKGAIEALGLDQDGNVLEGTTSNLFAFFGDRLVTPEEGILKGITRKVILEITQSMFDQELRQIHLSELLKADEVFISGTNKGIIPVVAVDDTRIGTGRPGTRTHQVMAALDRHTADLFRHL